MGNPNTKEIFIGELTPITIEEIPHTDYFFSNKRKVVVNKEMHLREGAMVKNTEYLWMEKI